MTYHIHIKGIVQGVGFRPFVYKLAIEKGLKGNVNNTTDGVHINIEGNINVAKEFLKDIVENAPPLAVITDTAIYKTKDLKFDDFKIVHSEGNTKPDLLLTPDFAICDDCRKELHDKGNRRYHYPFITCTNCGPRYSIITALPYDRPYTTMKDYIMCDKCDREYHNPLDRRYYSQTNSCAKCGIKMELHYEKDITTSPEKIIGQVVELWGKGKIVAIKGIGGFLLTCDANDKNAIDTLRERKHRPDKPFALMYPDMDMIKRDVSVSSVEEAQLKSTVAPVVLLQLKPEAEKNLYLKGIAAELDRIGIMTPYTPLYDLLLSQYRKPIIATSGNISNSTIIYTNDKALEELKEIADAILLNDRDIVIPQDDGVVKFTSKYKQKIIIRRSRGTAPSYINKSLKIPDGNILAMGAGLKSTFCLNAGQYFYISQYLGDTTTGYDAQRNYLNILHHFFNLFDFSPSSIYIDKHPDYYSSRLGIRLAKQYGIPFHRIQHHKAHFLAVMAENGLLNNNNKVLGVIWDGTGYGDDGNIWGGEFFIYNKEKIKRHAHLDYYDFILGDKMVMEPRISALALNKNSDNIVNFLKDKFSLTEWNVYSKILKQKSNLKTSSIGRLFDAAASVIAGIDKQTYEGHAAMILESMASEFLKNHSASLQDSYITDNTTGAISGNIFEGIVNDIKRGNPASKTAYRFHITLIHYILKIADDTGIKHIAFSGGVFQNSVLVDLLQEFLGEKYKLYFHKQLSPNDECISLGQMAAAIYNVK